MHPGKQCGGGTAEVAGGFVDVAGDTMQPAVDGAEADRKKAHQIGQQHDQQRALEDLGAAEAEPDAAALDQPVVQRGHRDEQSHCQNGAREGVAECGEALRPGHRGAGTLASRIGKQQRDDHDHQCADAGQQHRVPGEVPVA